MGLVDAAGEVGVAAGAEDGGGAGVGVDAGEVVGDRVKARSGSDGVGVGQEEAAAGLGEGALGAADDEGAELEAGVDVGKKGGRSVPRRRFSKS